MVEGSSNGKVEQWRMWQWMAALMVDAAYTAVALLAVAAFGRQQWGQRDK